MVTIYLTSDASKRLFDLQVTGVGPLCKRLWFNEHAQKGT